jgi:hypothetical protein
MPTEVIFTWNALPDIQNYEYAVTNNAIPPANGSYTTITSHKEGGLIPNTPYFFHLRGNCSPQDQTGWATVQFNTPPLSISSIHGNSQFNMEVYPNPVTDVLNVAITGMRGATARMQIVDMSGKIVETVVVTSDRVQVNMAKLAAGMYLLKYADNENAGVIRIEKQ